MTFLKLKNHPESGMVLVLALLVVALIASISFMLLAAATRDTERTELILHQQQQWLYAEGSVLWALDTLRQHALAKLPNAQLAAHSAAASSDAQLVINDHLPLTAPRE